MLHNNIHFGTRECRILVDKIVARFPLESEESYIINSGCGGRTRGPLYTCFNNKLKYLRKKGAIQSVSRSRSRSPINPPSPSLPLETTISDTSDKNWLKFNTEPWEIVESK